MSSPTDSAQESSAPSGLATDPATLRRRIEAVRMIPTLPVVAEKICAMVDREDTSPDQLARVISSDQVLTAKVLRLANSPALGFPGRIASITHALVILGFDVVKGMMVSSTVFDLMQEKMQGLWGHSYGCAVFAKVIAQKIGARNPEEMFVAGLLHDLGKVMMPLAAPEVPEIIEAKVRAQDLLWVEAETDTLGLTHCEVADWLAEKWNLPVTIREPLAFHHQPARARLAIKHTAAVHVANILVRAAGFGSPGDDLVPPIDRSAWDTLGLSEADLEEIIDEASGTLAADGSLAL